tara:strand:- start:864 stop:1004 length:141 start_codon:yes stop_codon:yes gene_type:complete
MIRRLGKKTYLSNAPSFREINSTVSKLGYNVIGKVASKNVKAVVDL